MKDPLRSYHCSGQITIAGISREKANKYLNTAYIDVIHLYDTTIRLSFRMNNVDAGYIDIPDIDDTLHQTLKRGEQFGSFFRRFDGELANFIGNTAAAQFNAQNYRVSYEQYGPDGTFAIHLKTKIKNSPPSINLFLSPDQSTDFLTLLQEIAAENITKQTTELVLPTGATTTDSLAPP